MLAYYGSKLPESKTERFIMKFLRWLNFIAVFFFLTSCGPGGTSASPTSTPLPPPPLVTVASAPDPTPTLTAYLDAFKADDYNAMYGALSKVAQDSITLEDFAKRNRDSLNEMSAGSFDYVVASSLVNPYSSEIAYQVTYRTALVGDIQRDIIAKLVLEGDQWKVNWDDSMILPELAGGNVLKMNYSVPSRGNIYDRNGDVIAAQADAYAFYVIPGNVTDESLGALISQVWLLCGISPDVLSEQIFNTPAQYPIPLCEASEQESERIRSIYPSGLEWETYNSRFYFQQCAGSNFFGYPLQVPVE